MSSRKQTIHKSIKASDTSLAFSAMINRDKNIAADFEISHETIDLQNMDRAVKNNKWPDQEKYLS